LGVPSPIKAARQEFAPNDSALLKDLMSNRIDRGDYATATLGW
jgi:hypothetical protein